METSPLHCHFLCVWCVYFKNPKLKNYWSDCTQNGRKSKLWVRRVEWVHYSYVTRFQSRVTNQTVLPLFSHVSPPYSTLRSTEHPLFSPTTSPSSQTKIPDDPQWHALMFGVVFFGIIVETSLPHCHGPCVGTCNTTGLMCVSVRLISQEVQVIKLCFFLQMQDWS